MKQIFVNVLYRNGRDLVLFEFNYQEDEDDPSWLISFHFCERHDFEERLRLAKSIFKDFYNDDSDDDVELIDWEEIK